MTAEYLTACVVCEGRTNVKYAKTHEARCKKCVEAGYTTPQWVVRGLTVHGTETHALRCQAEELAELEAAVSEYVPSYEQPIGFGVDLGVGD